MKQTLWIIVAVIATLIFVLSIPNCIDVIEYKEMFIVFIVWTIIFFVLTILLWLKVYRITRK